MSNDRPDASSRGLQGHSAAFGACALIAFTKRGCALAMNMAAQLPALDAFAGTQFSVHGPRKFADEFGMPAYESLGAWTAEQFARADALVYVGATGIAVRAIAPHVRDKFVDPAVVSVDEAGRFAVPLLSGHVGGANELARAVAQICGGQAVVSTATDVNELFAVDEWAARRGFCIVERAIAKEISARLLEGKAVGFASDFALDWEPPSGIVPVGKVMDVSASGVSAVEADGKADGDSADSAHHMPASDSYQSAVEHSSKEGSQLPPEVGFAVSLDDGCHPFERTLHLVPRIVTVGVGCRRDTDPAVLERAVDEALAAARVSQRSVHTLASIDVKKDEPAILELAEKRGWDLRFYTADELNAVPGNFESSEFVRRTVGVDNVCERAAVAQGGELMLGKLAFNGTTVAVAINGDLKLLDW